MDGWTQGQLLAFAIVLAIAVIATAINMIDPEI